MFKCDWVWEKSRPTGVLNAKRQPLRNKEDVLVFYSKQPTYNPQGLIDVNKMVGTGGTSANQSGNATGKITQTEGGKYLQKKVNYPKQIQKFNSASKTVHPTQKPVPLMEYLIKTYTNESETVLDFTMGSGSTGVAAKNINRKFIGIEMDESYFNIAKDRINAT
jgi:site-specific DNA-methyltransferase (adenine-specific)